MSPKMEEILMMRPPGRDRWGTIARVTLSTDARLVSRKRSISASSVSRSRFEPPIPALLTRMSMRPKAFRAAAAMASPASRSVTFFTKAV